MSWACGTNGRTSHLILETGTELIVQRHIGYPPDKWLLSGSGFLAGFDMVQLQSKDLQDAEREALHKVYGKLYSIVNRIGAL
jgi:hypothetical protein